jgi:hypothetical protein
VHEVVGDLNVLPGALEACRIGDVAEVQLQARLLQSPRFRAVPNQAARLLAPVGQRFGQAGADESRGAGYERPWRDINKLPRGE